MLTSLHVVSLYVSVRYRPLEAMCKVQVELVCQSCHFYYMENDPIVERDRAALMWDVAKDRTLLGSSADWSTDLPSGQLTLHVVKKIRRWECAWGAETSMRYHSI